MRKRRRAASLFLRPHASGGSRPGIRCATMYLKGLNFLVHGRHTMNLQQAIEKIRRLPQEEQQKVVQFVSRLESVPARETVPATQNGGSFSQETFFGIWCNRPEIADGSSWVRKLRENEWPS